MTGPKLDCCGFKELCLLLGLLRGWWQPGEPRTPAEILYSWGRLAFSTRQEPLPCSNIPSLPLGEPADEISIALTPDEPFPGAWQGFGAAPRHGTAGRSPWRLAPLQEGRSRGQRWGVQNIIPLKLLLGSSQVVWAHPAAPPGAFSCCRVALQEPDAAQPHWEGEMLGSSTEKPEKRGDLES